VNILVLDGNENQAVACVRSLGRAGHRVVVGANTSWSKAGWSRFATESFAYPAPQQGVQPFLAALEAATRTLDRPLILPMTERTTLPISEHRSSLEAAGARFALPAHEIVLRAFDKTQTTALAQSLGIDVPRSETLVSADDAVSYAQRATFPAVLKPRSSEEIGADGKVRATGKPSYVKTASEMASAFADIRTRCSAVIAQEFIAGTGSGYFALMRDGEVRAEFAHRRIRDVRPTGSGSALRESAPLDARVRDAGRAVLEALRWHGVAMVEFRIRDDGSPVFLEVNGRFWNSLPLAVYAGVDFPALLAAMIENGDVAPVTAYRLAVRCRWLLGDTRHLIEVWRGPPKGFPGAFPRRLSTLRDYLIPVPGTFHDNFTWDDPLPEAGDWIDFLFRKVAKASATRNAST
jgi:predicted ATP-grasp superfamily ATP-dependent carboligase